MFWGAIFAPDIADQGVSNCKVLRPYPPTRLAAGGWPLASSVIGAGAIFPVGRARRWTRACIRYVRFGSNAVIPLDQPNVRFAPIADIPIWVRVLVSYDRDRSSTKWRSLKAPIVDVGQQKKISIRYLISLSWVSTLAASFLAVASSLDAMPSSATDMTL